MSKRKFTPAIISTKETLLNALRQGDITSSKYNLLNEEEKLFVELVVFGDFSAEQAMKQIKGADYKRAQGNRMVARPNVAEALEELSYKKNKKFMAEIAGARDMALRKAMYILSSTEDEAVALAASKLIMDKAEKVTTEKDADKAINAIQFNIQMAPKPIDDPMNPKVDLEEPVYFEDANFEVKTEEPAESGLDFTLNYTNIDNYKK